MNSVQMGSADAAPSSFSSRLSSNPTQTTHSNREVNPANHPSCEVPVLPAAGTLKPRARAPAAVPLRSHLLQHVHHQVGHPRIECLPRLRRVLIKHLALRRAHHGQHGRLHVNAAIGEHGIGAGDFERRSFIGSQRHRRRGLDVIVQAGAARHVHHRPIAHHLRHFHRGHVQRVRQRLPQRDRSPEILLEIARLVVAGRRIGKVVGSSSTVVAGVNMFVPPSTAVSSAAAYTNGLKAEPGGRSAVTWFNWLVP